MFKKLWDAIMNVFSCEEQVGSAEEGRQKGEEK